MMKRTLVLAGVVTALVIGNLISHRSDQVRRLSATSVQRSGRTPVDVFLDLSSAEHQKRVKALETIRANWNAGDTAMMIESARFAPGLRTRAAIIEVLAELTGQSFGMDLDRWYQWLWNHSNETHPDYASFKRRLYSRVDPRFAEYFANEYPATIRLDEVRWGGVRRDGIPPLKNPKTLNAAEAAYLADTDVVFGVHFNGHARAYPKRILAWHEMVKDVVGGKSINGVYCTLCGSMIVYETEHNGKHYELGTSGFLYRSNKLMYDHETKSMWSTLKGTPVIGPLVGKGIKLEPLHVVTTTWGEWKVRHPESDVLSLQTGHRRDYGEGVAYRDYFATDRLMFTVPKTDSRLKNKDEVLIVRGDAERPLAIAADFLKTNRIHHDSLGGVDLVIITDRSGANRVYQSKGRRFKGLGNDTRVQSEDGVEWRVTEDALVPVEDGTEGLPRMSAHRAFWFGWYAAFPNTRLVQ